jgi:hypothetical protein
VYEQRGTATADVVRAGLDERAGRTVIGFE